MDWLDEELNAIEQKNLRRRLAPLRPLSPVEAVIAGRRVVLFSTNDYLGLSSHPRVIARTIELTEQWGIGPRSAALLGGYTELHEQLENELARFKGTEAALLFPTGYMTNLGILQSLGGGEAEIFSDALNHASIIDGCRLSRSKVHVYRHADADHLESLVRSSRARRKLIVSDALFSMDGDAAPLRRLVEIKEKYGCLLIIDEAHSTFVFGETGKGLAERFGVSDRIDVQMGTLSKAFGSLGGFVATSEKLRDYFVNRARSFIFTTALPIPAVAAALAALETFQAEPDIRARLWENVKHFHEAMRIIFHHGDTEDTENSPGSPWLRGEKGPSPIFPIIVGEAAAALKLSEQLLDRGFHVPAIRPPTVAEGTARLRISLSACHGPEQLAGLVEALAELANRSPLMVD
jgi:8-amino-7-oxononanoate synthase